MRDLSLDAQDEDANWRINLRNYEIYPNFTFLNYWLGLGPYKKGTFEFFLDLIETPSGDFKQISEEF